MPDTLTDHAGLDAAEHAAILAMVCAHQGLGYIFAG